MRERPELLLALKRVGPGITWYVSGHGTREHDGFCLVQDINKAVTFTSVESLIRFISRWSHCRWHECGNYQIVHVISSGLAEGPPAIGDTYERR